MNCVRCESEIDHIAERAIAEAVARSAAEIDRWWLDNHGCVSGPSLFLSDTAMSVASAIRDGFNAYHFGKAAAEYARANGRSAVPPESGANR